MKMAVAGKLNVDLCARLVAAGVKPVGLHGASSLVVQAVDDSWPVTSARSALDEPVTLAGQARALGELVEKVALGRGRDHGRLEEPIAELDLDAVE